MLHNTESLDRIRKCHVLKEMPALRFLSQATLTVLYAGFMTGLFDFVFIYLESCGFVRNGFV